MHLTVPYKRLIEKLVNWNSKKTGVARKLNRPKIESEYEVECAKRSTTGLCVRADTAFSVPKLFVELGD